MPDITQTLISFDSSKNSTQVFKSLLVFTIIIFLNNCSNFILFSSFDVHMTFPFKREHMFKKKDTILLLSKHVSRRKVMSQYVREVAAIKEKCHYFLLI